MIYLGLRYNIVLIVFIEKTYLITRDIVRTLEVKCGYKFEDAIKERIAFLEDEFIQGFKRFIPIDISFEVLSIPEIREGVPVIEWPILSLDRICFDNADFYLDITRQTDSDSGLVRLAPRFGALSLEDQVRGFPKALSLVDVGVFDGNTLLKVYFLLESFGISIKTVGLGVASQTGFRKVNGIRSVGVGRIFNLYEWVELRDLFGIDGRSVFSESKRKFIPYWENLGGWAGIQEQDISDARNYCLDMNQRLKDLLTNNGYDINPIGECVAYGGKK